MAGKVANSSSEHLCKIRVNRQKIASKTSTSYIRKPSSVIGNPNIKFILQYNLDQNGIFIKKLTRQDINGKPCYIKDFFNNFVLTNMKFQFNPFNSIYEIKNSFYCNSFCTDM